MPRRDTTGIALSEHSCGLATYPVLAGALYRFYLGSAAAELFAVQQIQLRLMLVWDERTRELFLLAFTEAWERFSYYGVRALLVLFLSSSAATGGMNWSADLSLKLLGWFVALVYVLPVAGGWVGDRLIGPRRSVRVGAGVLILAYLLLAASAWVQQTITVVKLSGDVAPVGPLYSFLSIFSYSDIQLMMSTALVLIALGTGLFKPNITVLVGNLYQKNDPAREAGFLIFYLFMNLGVIFCGLVIGTLGERIAWHFGFLAAGAAMLFSLLVFSVSRSGIKHANPTPANDEERGKMSRRGLSGAERSGIAAIAILGIFATLFWTGLEQTAGLLNLFAFENTNREIVGFEIPATWFQSLNPFFVIVLAPGFALLWRVLASRGRDPRIEWKFVLGLLSMASAFGVMSYAATTGEEGVLANPGWLVVAYLLLTIGELCIWTISLAAVTRLSPERHSGLVVGLWYLAIALGGWCAGQIGAFVAEIPIGQVFDLLSEIFVIGACTLAAVSPIIGRLVRRAVSA